MIDWAFALKILPTLGRAAIVTVEATILGFAIAATLGLVLAIARMARRRWIAWPVAGFIEAIRGTPLLIQIFFL